MEQRNFYSAKSHLYEFFGIDMDDELFETIGLHAWDKINNKIYRFYKFRGKVEDFKLELPCNVAIIEYVQGAGETISSSADAHYNSAVTEEWIEDNKTSNSVYYGRGHYVDYVRSGNSLIFNRDNIRDNIWVSILYKGIVLDDEGLPNINFKEEEAIAKYCAYVDLQKRAMITKDQSTFQMAQLMRQDWVLACSAARTPIYISQNDMDNILDVQSSWDRKRFGKSLKIIR